HNLARSYSLTWPDLSPYARLVDEYQLPASIPKDYRSGYTDSAGAGILLDWKFRPLEEIKLADIRNISKSIRLNAGLKYDLFDWLKIDVSWQYSNTSGFNRNFKSIATYE